MEAVVEDIVIVGAGIAGLTTSLGLHRLGIRSLVVESSDKLRVSGFALTIWSNAWKALDAVGIGDDLRKQHELIQGLVTTSTANDATREFSFNANGADGGLEARCVQRRLMLEALEQALPKGTIRYSAKVVSIEESGFFKLVHLVDGTILKTKVLIGCDGVNSVVTKWLGFKKPSSTGRIAIRGFVDYKSGHDFELKFYQYFGNGIRSGFIPCDDKTIYWFFTFTPGDKEKYLEENENPSKMKEFVLNRGNDLPESVRKVIELTGLDSIVAAPLRYRSPWDVLWGNISKGNVCVAGDSLHPMTPDIGQGGCSALEDAVVLARVLGKALLKRPSEGKHQGSDAEQMEYTRIKMALKKYGKERKVRSIDLISTAYVVGLVQQSNGKMMNFFRDKFLAEFLAKKLLTKANFDCGNLNV